MTTEYMWKGKIPKNGERFCIGRVQFVARQKNAGYQCIHLVRDNPTIYDDLMEINMDTNEVFSFSSTSAEANMLIDAKCERIPFRWDVEEEKVRKPKLMEIEKALSGRCVVSIKRPKSEKIIYKDFASDGNVKWRKLLAEYGNYDVEEITTLLNKYDASKAYKMVNGASNTVLVIISKEENKDVEMER